MTSIFSTDRVIIGIVETDKYGRNTVTETEYDARVDDYNRLVLGPDGKEVMGAMLVYLDYSTNVEYNSYVKIVKKNGLAYDNPSKKWQIKSLSKVGGFSVSHYEVIL